MIATSAAGSAVRRGADQEMRDGIESASAWPRGRCAAGGRRTKRASRSSDSARWAPRLFGATAWISSTITVRALASIARPDSRAEQDVERLRRRHQDVRRTAAHRVALGGGRVARADPGADFHIGKPAPAELLPDAGQRRLEVAMDVVRQRLERRDVDDLSRVGEGAVETLPHEVVDRGQERRERLARAGRRGDERVAAGLDRGPRFGLRRGGRGETLGEPVRDRRVEQRFERRRQSRRSPAPARAGSRGWN